jgi:hypothetical protein
MQVLVLGINHQIQPVRIYSGSTTGELERFEQGQKDRFRDLVQRRITERKVQFVGEEARHGEAAIAKEVCDAERCRYANIEINLDERARRNIPVDYESDPKMSVEQKEAFHQQREEYMFGRAVAEAADADHIIVICGRYHTPGLARRFRATGHQVHEADIQSEPWYVEDWMGHMMRL